MKVKIVKASKPTYWYFGSIGKVFDVVESRFTDDKYDVVGKPLSINKEDCEAVK